MLRSLIGDGHKSSDVQEDCKVGDVQLFIKDGEEKTLGATGLVDIKIDVKSRKSGYARKVIDAIRHTTGNELKIHDIKKNYLSTWRKLGVDQFQNSSGTPVKVSKYSGVIFGVIPAIGNEKKKEPEISGLSM